MLAAGDKAPEFELPTVSGKTTSLRDLTQSGAVLLAFFKVSCPTCQYTLPFLERLTSAKGLTVVGISQDERGKTVEFGRMFGSSFPMALDRAGGNYPVSDAYRITQVPSLFLIEGTTITQAVSGFSRGDLEQLGKRFGLQVFDRGEKIPEFRPG